MDSTIGSNVVRVGQPPFSDLNRGGGLLLWPPPRFYDRRE
jgi:hypothetical protein